MDSRLRSRGACSIESNPTPPTIERRCLNCQRVVGPGNGPGKGGDVSRAVTALASALAAEWPSRPAEGCDNKADEHDRSARRKPGRRIVSDASLEDGPAPHQDRAPALDWLCRGDECDAQSEKDRGDTEPYRSPKTKLRGTRRRFAAASPHEEEPLGAALNPPVPWRPNDTKCRPGQCEATGDQKRSADYHASNVPGWSGTSPSDAQSRAATGAEISSLGAVTRRS